MDAPTDEQLLAEYLRGKTASFELLVRRHAEELHQFVMRFTGDSAAADDVVQEAMLQVHSAGASFDPGRRFKPWLFTIAANKARDYLRRRARLREVPFEAQPGNDRDTKQRYLDLLTGDDAAPDEDLLVDEKRRIVRHVVEQIPPNLREVLVLAYYHRFPYREIAEIVQIPLGTVKSRLHAAVVAFGEQYRRAVARNIAQESQDAGERPPE